MEESDLVQGVTAGILKGWFERIGTCWHERRQKRRLRDMLQDKRFPKGYRSTSQLMKGIGADRQTAERLLLAIEARKSETTDEWTFNPPPKRR